MTRILSALSTAVVLTACSDTEQPLNVVPVVTLSVEQEPVLGIEEDDYSNEEVMAGLSAVQLSELRKAAVLLARIAVSEGTSLQPLSPYWKNDMQGIYHVALTRQKRRESLREVLSELSPHVAQKKDYTRPRQHWTSTLQAFGDKPPRLWVECTSWYTNTKGRKRGLPKGCNGVWKNGAHNWVRIRDYAIKLVQMKNPPSPVYGNPLTWGGMMDLDSFLERSPHMCLLPSDGNNNYFFGLRKDPDNQCQPVPKELRAKSRLVSVQIMKRDLKRMREKRMREQLEESLQ